LKKDNEEGCGGFSQRAKGGPPQKKNPGVGGKREVQREGYTKGHGKQWSLGQRK